MKLPMPEASTNFLPLLQKYLPLLLIIGFLLYGVWLSLRNQHQDNRNIDELIEQKKRKISGFTPVEDSLLQQLRQHSDNKIKELVKQLDWGDPLSLPQLSVPYALDQERLIFQIKKIINQPSTVTISSFTELINLLEKKIISLYLKTPLSSLQEDDLLHAFSILGVRQDSTSKQIKNRYHKLSQNFHPDRFSEKLQQKYKEEIQHNYITIKKAYEILIAREER
jgi:DnaJ-domain-containing protein 1